MADPAGAPLFSVVVTLVDGGAQLHRCLSALADQPGAQRLEVLVPYDDSAGDLADFRRDFPSFRFLPLGQVATARSPASAAGQHELYDRRRAVALAAATGDIIGMVEDRGVPRPGWAHTLLELHRRLPHLVIGGAVDWAGSGVLSWAVYACDFGRYESMHPEGPREFLTDCNLSYKRPAVDSTRDLWRERYHETQVHDRLREQGAVLWYSPEAVVEEARQELRLGSLLAERFAWGRLYGAIRITGGAFMTRLIRAATTLLLPFVLYLRILRRTAGRHPGRLIAATPALLLLLGAWSLGECIGYLTGEP